MSKYTHVTGARVDVGGGGGGDAGAQEYTPRGALSQENDGARG